MRSLAPGRRSAEKKPSRRESAQDRIGSNHGKNGCGSYQNVVTGKGPTGVQHMWVPYSQKNDYSKR